MAGGQASSARKGRQLPTALGCQGIDGRGHRRRRHRGLGRARGGLDPCEQQGRYGHPCPGESFHRFRTSLPSMARRRDDGIDRPGLANLSVYRLHMKVTIIRPVSIADYPVVFCSHSMPTSRTRAPNFPQFPDDDKLPHRRDRTAATQWA